jgi:hypothetical protein
MKLEQNFMIDGDVVVETGVMDNLKTFTHYDFEDAKVYFVNNKGEVVGIMNIHTETGQGEGYIDTVEVIS